MSRRGRLDAVVAGGGVVGAATALMLAREGLRTALVEPRQPASWQRGTRDLRVFAFAPDNAAFMAASAPGSASPKSPMPIICSKASTSMMPSATAKGKLCGSNRSKDAPPLSRAQ